MHLRIMLIINSFKQRGLGESTTEFYLIINTCMVGRNHLEHILMLKWCFIFVYLVTIFLLIKHCYSNWVTRFHKIPSTYRSTWNSPQQVITTWITWERDWNLTQSLICPWLAEFIQVTLNYSWGNQTDEKSKLIVCVLQRLIKQSQTIMKAYPFDLDWDLSILSAMFKLEMPVQKV